VDSSCESVIYNSGKIHLTQLKQNPLKQFIVTIFNLLKYSSVETGLWVTQPKLDLLQISIFHLMNRFVPAFKCSKEDQNKSPRDSN
jgi:hypothetical protein